MQTRLENVAQMALWLILLGYLVYLTHRLVPKVARRLGELGMVA